MCISLSPSKAGSTPGRTKSVHVPVSQPEGNMSWGPEYANLPILPWHTAITSTYDEVVACGSIIFQSKTV